MSTDGTPTEPTSKKHPQWVWISTLVCCAAMGVVIAMAVKGRQDDDAALAAAPWNPSNAQTPLDRAADSPCGVLDPDNPAAISFDVPLGGIDFGSVQQGVQVTKELTFRSTGKGALCVLNLKSGCGCYKVALVDGTPPLKYEPGESGTIKVTMDSSGKIGRVVKHIRVYTNSIATPMKRVRCQVEVSRGLIVNRTRLFMHTVPTNTPTSATVVVQSSLDGPAWTITKVEGTRQRPDGSKTPYTFTVSDEKSDAKWRKRHLTITHPGLAKSGLWQEPLVVHTTHPDRPQISLEIRMSAMNRILSDKRALSLGHVREGERGEPAIVRFRAGSPDVTFTLTRAYVVPPTDGRPGSGGGFVAKVGDDDQGWFVQVHYDGRTRAPGLLRGDLIVHTSDRLQSQVRLPIRATILDK